MSRLAILICRIDDERHPNQFTELDRIDVPPLDAHLLQQETALDPLEAQTLTQGHQVMQHLLKRPWERVDDQLVAHYRELFFPAAGDEGRSRPDRSSQPAGSDPPLPASAGTRRRERARGAGQ
jgi:hypothetical protein